MSRQFRRGFGAPAKELRLAQSHLCDAELAILKAQTKKSACCAGASQDSPMGVSCIAGQSQASFRRRTLSPVEPIESGVVSRFTMIRNVQAFAFFFFRNTHADDEIDQLVGDQ